MLAVVEGDAPKDSVVDGVCKGVEERVFVIVADGVGVRVGDDVPLGVGVDEVVAAAVGDVVTKFEPVAEAEAPKLCVVDGVAVSENDGVVEGVGVSVPVPVPVGVGVEVPDMVEDGVIRPLSDAV